jgi:hypothetical protein
MTDNQRYGDNAREGGVRRREVTVTGQSAARSAIPEPSFRFFVWSVVLFAVVLGSIVAFDYSNGDERLSLLSDRSLKHFAGGPN